MVAIPKLLLLWTVLYFVIFALPALFFPASFRKATDKIVKSEEWIRLASILALIFGFLYLLVYVKLDGTWYMIFSIMGWLSLLKGVVNLRFPALTAKKAKMLYKTDGMVRIMGVVMILIAAFFTWAALVKF